MMSADSHNRISRRRFLIRSGWLAVGATVVASCSSFRSLLPALPTFDDPELEDSLTWVQVLPTGGIRFFCPRMEMGQGASLGLSQVVAEELNVDQSEIECVLPNTQQTPPFKMTVSSESIADFFDPVSYGAARLREALRTVAAKKAGIRPGQIRDGRGGFVLPDGSALRYGALVPSEPLVISDPAVSEAEKNPPRYALQRQGAYKAIGHKWKHTELEKIVTGQTVFSQDVALPAMLHGQVIRPPSFGAILLDADGRVAQAMSGVVAVVVDKKSNFVGVVADNPFVLPGAIEAISAKWHVADDIDQNSLDEILDVEDLRARDDFEHKLASSGDIDIGRQRARHRVSARYDTPFLAHAAMEPRAAVASVGGNRVEIWCGSQDPFFVQRRVAEIVGRAEDEVVVYSHRMGGAFGGRIRCQASEEAAILSAAVDRPVRVSWDREAEFQNNYFQPVYSHFIDAGVTPTGAISHWDHDFVSSPILTGSVPKSISWAVDMFTADEGTARGGMPPYRVADRRVRYSDVRTEVPVGAWRGLGAAPNSFAIESVMDELAASAGIDPLEFRLQNLSPTQERLAGVLRRVAKLSGWGRVMPQGAGRGLACAVYKGETAVAIVVEIEVDRATGEVRATKVWCAQDCGLVVNPNQVEAQIAGNIVWGCGMALKEQITIAAGSVEERNFDGYEILRHHETPEINVALVAPPDTPPVGAGEAAIAPVAAAIANAVFDATGHRARRLPICGARVIP
ncbi:MAG: xanthine dehydrogenase family protein molybdopterin-binding subunit [Alphaproteobacteria bacterium]|jgi:isoquinoline 1-oxidoreductase subunit beta|nr:xanthine dehydrogenase family protein molybdopterin-binding subunit [Alphaproteobacteria bacterium]